MGIFLCSPVHSCLDEWGVFRFEYSLESKMPEEIFPLGKLNYMHCTRCRGLLLYW